MEFVPNIIGFACQWCTYAGADLLEISVASIRPPSN